MDDFVISNLNESRNEWCSRLVSIFTPLVADGVRSIFSEAWKICIQNDEANKYLMTFQNLLSRVPKWNNEIIEKERVRIVEKSGCDYLEDLITCVHIIQLKILTCIRVGNKQKKIDITIPKLDNFIHKVYISVARKLYSNVYLFEKNIAPLQLQKNNRELEMIVQESIMNVIRESIPTEEIIRAYMDESIEHEEEVIVETIDTPEEDDDADVQKNNITANMVDTVESEREPLPEPEEEAPVMTQTIQDINPDEKVVTTLSFNDIDSVLDEVNHVNEVDAPKSIEKLEELSTSRAMENSMYGSDDDDDEKLKIDTKNLQLTDFDVLDEQETSRLDPTKIVLNDVEELY
uniref:Uncharacterized protein n=1 Tax=viral metagenome TaxID=1070528 RepID=A0A6C0IQI4_9ZZZZ